MKQRIDTWKQLELAGDPTASDYLKKITEEAMAEGKLSQMGEVASFLMDSAAQTLDKVETEIKAATLHQRLGDLSDAINLAYIARRYFGKSRQWLYQRLKGLIVNGRPAAFTADEEAQFYAALNEIGLEIKAVTGGR